MEVIHVLLMLFFFLQGLLPLEASELPWDCKEWSKASSQQCCHCQSSLELVCLRNCPSGYYEKGQFLIKEHQPSACLRSLDSDRASSGKPRVELFDKRARICSPCDKHCARCNGPTERHCGECSADSYKDVGDEATIDGNNGSGEIISSSLLLPDGNIVVFKKSSIKTRRHKRTAKVRPVIIGKSVSWNSSDGISGFVSWKGPGRSGQPLDLLANRSRWRRFASGRPIVIGDENAKVVRPPKTLTSKSKPVKRPQTKVPTSITTGTPIQTVTNNASSSPVPSSTEATVVLEANRTELTNGTTTNVQTTKVIKNSSTMTSLQTTSSLTESSKRTTGLSTTASTTEIASTTEMASTTEVASTTEMETTTKKTETSTKLLTTGVPSNRSTFASFRESKENAKTWFRCIAMCPRGKFIVRETKCRTCNKNECPGGRECHVVDVHNVCVRSCQPGFVKHIGLMECLCPGPVVNQTCTQPVHPVYHKRFDTEDYSVVTNLSIVLPIVICFLLLCAMIMYIYWKQRVNVKEGQMSKSPCVLPSMESVWNMFRHCCPENKEEAVVVQAIHGASRQHSVHEIRCPPRTDDRWKEDTLGRITWKFDDNNPNKHYGASQRRWRIPIRWQVSTPPSIPKKKSNRTTFSKVQAFLSKYTPDISDGNKENNSIYKEPPSTPKDCRLTSVRDISPDIHIISPANMVPAEVIQSWLHSSFHTERNTNNPRLPPINRKDGPRRNPSENEHRQKRKSLRPVSNCYESIEGSMETEEAIYESLSEDEYEAGSDANSYASVNDKRFANNAMENGGCRPIYANMEGPPVHANSGASH